MIVLDTHVLLWTVSDDRKLGRKTRAMLDRVWANGELAVPAIAFWEARNRFIVATALVHEATLITADERLLGWQHSLERHDARK